MKYIAHKIADALRYLAVGETLTLHKVRAVSVRRAARDLWGAGGHQTRTSGPNRADVTLVRIK